ncbi:MAG: DNA starvation/stationary phase protection protein Dps [Rhodospirillales bacterium 70-18]|nr:DNA starvation/stationary phase protection protein Dps [Rhodospirillales bacterium]OJY72241.1 MAG: DNA starvation/stationary phase protection protein Dps [Rhodospirillales bacterium 70-18]
MKTLNALDSNIRTAAISLLNARVADTIDLALATKQAHWNLRGPQFIAVHEMLDTLRTELDDYVDTMAERVTALGGTALGTLQVTAKVSSLTAYPTNIHAIPDHLKALSERLAALGTAVRTNIDEATEAGDAGTADLFTGMSRGLDKWLWFLEAHQGS